MELVTLPETKQMDRQGEQQNGNATAMHTKETDKAERTDELTGKLLDIWEGFAANHPPLFWAETDIERIRAQAENGTAHNRDVGCCVLRNHAGRIHRHTESQD